MFKKAAIFSDIHFGKKNDSDVHNNDCLDYIKWFCSKVIEHKCDNIIFMGDWFDNRSRIRLDTNYFSNLALECLIKTNLPITMIVGNHDMFYSNNRTIHSLEFMKNIKSIRVIDKITEIGDCLFIPYVVGQEFTSIPTYKSRYVFGHLELPLFLMNNYSEKEYNGGLHMNDFVNNEIIFSGHFHKRQIKINKHNIPIHYIGAPFSHDMNDANDHNKGFCILEHNKEPLYYDYNNGPRYIKTLLSKFDENNHNIKDTVLLINDMGLDDNHINQLKDDLSSLCRKIEIENIKTQKDDKKEVEEILMEHKSIEEIVEEQLLIFDVNHTNLKKEKLISIFKGISK